jgi:hypothetical protein
MRSSLPHNDSELQQAILMLLEREPQSKEELRELQQESLELALHIQHSAPLGQHMAEEVWHFLSDADIRYKDPEYRRVQLEKMRHILAHWPGKQPS